MAEQLLSWLNDQVNFRQAYSFSWRDFIKLLAEITNRPGVYGIPPENVANLVSSLQEQNGKGKQRRTSAEAGKASEEAPVSEPPFNDDKEFDANLAAELEVEGDEATSWLHLRLSILPRRARERE
ncbi:hypothetical protein CNMCM6106_003123 [Aspergillus hiratsukae]|uniref:Uncharacterized protein n=1 Tax=Aspergillus hiratsukae TaxID=1194566 RepID=A0A8H6Q5S2_9EURO|nr:hypothetical protein CNMCM6106_003123 [Aspergillus hiratsukae]